MDSKLASSLEDLEKLFTTKMSDYEDKLVRATSAGNGSPPELSSLAKEFSEFRTFVWQALSKFKFQIETLSHGFDRHETLMRRKVLLFHGVPEVHNEKLPDVVHQILSNQMKLPEVGKDSIHVCHRLGSSQGKSRPILVRMFTMEHRHMVWENKTSLKGSGITISEFLTHVRHQTFTAARKHFGMKNCWSVEGKITVITPDKKRQKIETLTELRSLISKFPSSAVDLDADILQERSPPKGQSTETGKASRKLRRRN